MENMDSNLSRMNPLAESTLIATDELRNVNKRKTLSPLSNASTIRPRISNLSIDPSVLTNAQSKGIVKRLISYHEESQNDNNRNRYVYNRYGDFPIVHLKKTELKRNLVRSNSVRIAPPSKYNFNREARAAILRSNSFQISQQFGVNSPTNKLSPVRMKAQDTSHQIITNHEPILLEEQPQNSKSVLDILEKNCRKRINQEESTMDRQKPQKRMCQQEVEVPPINTTSTMMQSGKRARTSPEKSVTDAGISQQIKRFRIKNNALLCSLSSSRHDLIPKQNGNVVKTQSNRNFIPQTVEKKSSDPPRPHIEPPQKSPASAKPKLKLFNVDATQPPPNFRGRNRHNFNDDDDDEDEFKLNFVKPKDKPSNINFDANQQVEKEKLSRMLHVIGDGLTKTISEYTRDTVDSKKTEEIPKSSASISFTTSTTTTVSSIPISSPSSSTSDVTSTLPKISFTNSSIVNPVEIVKLPEKPVIEAEKVELKKSEEPTKPTVAPLLPTIQPISSENKEEPKKKQVTFGSFNFSPTTSTSSNTISSILSPPKPSLPSIDANKSALISFSPAPAQPQKTDSPAEKPTENIPVLGGFSFAAPKEAEKTPTFSFGAPKTTEITAVSSSTTTATNSLFGSIVTTSASSVATVAPTFSFGSSNSIAPATTSAPSALPTISFNKTETTQSSGVGFSFGGTTNSIAPVATTSSSGFSFGATATAKPTAAVGGFSFSATQNKTETPKFEGFGQTQLPTTQVNPLGMFQSPTANSTVNSPKPDASGVFSRLGGKTNDPNSAPAFGAFGGLEKKSSQISFGMENKQPEITPSFNFGGEKKNDAPPAFGSIQNSNDSNKQISTFSFGQKAAENKTTFSFGGEKPTENTSFSFGGADKSSEVKQAFGFGGIQEKKDAPPSFNFSASTQKQDAPPAFSFNAVKPQEQAKISFGLDNKNELPKPTFGGTNSSTGSSIFGAAVKPFSSKPDATPTFGQNSVPSFGQTTPFNSSNATPVFGSNNTQQNPPAFGSGTSTMFGNSNNNTPSFNQPQNAFGNNQQNSATSGGIFSFNQANKPVQPTQSPPTGTVFSFGNSSNAPQSTPQANVFGVSGNSEQNVSASFSFKPSTGIATTNNTGGIFNASSPPNAFQFGQGVTNASASYTFSPSSATTANTQPPAFNFNGPQTAPVMQSAAFNFQAQQQQQQMGMAGGQNNAGIFNIGVGGGQQKRPYRQATRRLK